ncbi:MAG TPA: hypothetical protein VI322_05795 [Candidatus Saccharimonadia bacterium]
MTLQIAFWFVHMFKGRVKSQFFRRALAAWLGGNEKRDWYVNRQLGRVRTMAQGRWWQANS